MIGARLVGRAGPSTAEKSAELRALGVAEESIAEHLERYGFTDSDRDALEVWECHFPALAVFQRCQQTTVAGMSGVAFLGISSQEIESACKASDEPFTAELVDDVQMIAKGAAAVLNKKHK